MAQCALSRGAFGGSISLMKKLASLLVLSSLGWASTKMGPTDIVNLEMRSKRITISASDQGTRYRVSDKETELVGRQLDLKTLKKNFPKVYKILDHSVAPLFATNSVR